MSTWRILDHPADLAIEARGNTPAAAIEGMLQALMEQLLGPSRGSGGEPQRIRVNGLDQAECLVSTCNEILYRVNVDGWWFRDFQVLEIGATYLCLVALGGRRGPDLPLEQEIKAATYHDLNLEQQPDGSWRLRMVFDL